MEEDILKQLKTQDEKLEAIYHSVEKTRKYFMWTLIITLVTVLLPLLGLMFAVPLFLQTLNLGNLGL